MRPTFISGLTYVAAILLGTTVSAQQASYTYIDQPPPYSNPGPTSQPPGPWLVALNSPKIGTTFQIQVPASSLVFTPCPFSMGVSVFVEDVFLLTGVGNPNLDLGHLGIPGFWFSSAEITVLMPLGSPGYPRTMSLPIPADPSLAGAQFYQQVLVMNSWNASQCYALSSMVRYGLSRGGHGVIGM